MPDAETLPRVHATDTTTAHRAVTHGHFAPGEEVWVVRGSTEGQLLGTRMTVVAPSWHTPTDQDGWRLRNPGGGTRTFLTGHPRYLIHAERHCPYCLTYALALAAELLPQLPATGTVSGDWYLLSALDQLVHTSDAP